MDPARTIRLELAGHSHDLEADAFDALAGFVDAEGFAVLADALAGVADAIRLELAVRTRLELVR